MDNVELFRRLTNAYKEVESGCNYRGAWASKIEVFCIDSLRALGVKSSKPLLNSFARCVLLLVSGTKFKGLLRITADLVQTMEANTDCLCATYAMGHLAQFERKNMRPLVIRAFDAVVPVLRSIIKSVAERDKALVCLFTAKKFSSRAEFKLGAAEVRLLAELVNAPMVSKDEEMTSLCIGISQILHRRRLVEIPHSSEACVKMLNKLLELTNTPSASLRKQASELLATLIYTYSLIEVDSDDYYPSRDSVKLSSVTATEDISPALLDFIICPLKQIWRSADDSNNPYIRHTIIMTYISLFHMYDQQILMKNLFDLIKMALELLEAKPYSENDENFEYVCHLGKILTYSAFIKNNSLDIKKYILDILIRRFLMVWVNPESKTDDIPTSSVAKVCILWTVSALLPTIEFSDIFEDPDFSNTIIELISATPLQHLPHVLRCANSICMHSPKSSVKMFCTLAVMAEQEFTMTLAPKYSCENLRKYSIAVSAILPNVCGRSEYLSQKVIYSLLKMGLSLVSTDVSKVTGQKAAISVKSGLSIIAGLSHSHLKYVMSSMKTLISSMESLSTIYTCDDMLDDLTMRGVLDVRISILDVLHRLFKNHQMLSSSVLKSINTIFGRAIDLASHMLNNYKQLLSSRSYVKPDIISLLNSFLKRLLISPHLDVLGCEWNYKLMYLSYRLICIQHEKDYPIKKKLNILKRSWKPNCSSLYLNIIDKYLLLSLQHQQPLSRQLSSQQQSNTNWSSQTTSSSQITLDICKPIVEFAFDPFCIKHWFYDFSIVDDSRAFTAIDDLLRDSINEGTLKDNNILKPPGPPGYTLVVDNAILVLSSALSMSGEFITDFLSKLRKSFCLEAKSERSEKVMNVNRMNIVVCLYYMLEHAQKNSIEVTDSYIDIILGILIKALACPDSTICLVSCQALRLLFTLPGTENVLQSTLESVIEEAKPNVASLALACMFSGTKVQDDIAYAHKISGYVVHKLSICDSDDIMWHLHSLSLIMRTSIVPLVPYLEDILMRVRGLYLSDSSSLYFRVSLTSLAKACLIIPLSVGSILESIIHFANSQLNASPELLSNISDVLGCMRIDETPFAAIKAMRCARLLLDFPDLVNPSAEIAYLVRMLGEKNGELCSLIKETAIECLFDIVKSKKYTSDRNLSSPSVLIKFIHAVDQDLDQVVLRKLHDIVIELIKINIDKAPVILVGMCKSILLDDKKCTEDYEQAYMSQNLMSSSSTVREEYFSSIASSDNARQHSPRKRSLTPSVDPASADYSALLLRYLPPDSDHPCTPGLEVRAHTLYYLRRSMELAADDDDSRPDNSHPPKFSYVRHGALIKSIGDIIKMGCYGANSGHRVICIESHKLLYTVLKYFSNITYPGVYNDVTLIDSYQSQILAVVRKTLALDSNLKLNVLSFKILFMQAMNSSYDTSLIYNGINTLVTESLIRLDEFKEPGFYSEDHLIMKSLLSLIWSDILSSISSSDLNSMIELDVLKNIYIMCLSNYGTYANTLLGIRTVEKPLFCFPNEEYRNEFMRFFSELTVRVDANASTFLKVIRSLLQHSNQFIADTLFRKMEETKTLALQRSQLDGTQDGPKISLFTSGIINFCLEILDKCCDQDPRDSHEINEDLNNLGCDPMIVASSFILKILSLENIVFSKRMKSDILARLVSVCEAYCRTKGTKVNEDTLDIMSNLLQAILRDKGHHHLFERTFKTVLTVLRGKLPFMGARHGEDAVPSIEHASSTIIKIGRILSDLIVEDDDSEISVKLLIPISFCVLAVLSYSDEYSDISPQFTEAISHGISHAASSSDNERVIRNIVLSLVSLLRKIAHVSSSDFCTFKHGAWKINSLYSMVILIRTVSSAYYSHVILLRIQNIINEYMRYGYPFNIAAVKCVADLCSLSDPTNSADKRVFGEHCIKLLLPPLLSAFIATSDDTLSIEIAKLLAKIQSYAPSDEKKDAYIEYIVNLFSRVLAMRPKDHMGLRTCIGEYLLNLAPTHPKFRSIVFNMCHHRRSALKSCMIEVSNMMTTSEVSDTILNPFSMRT